MIERSEVLLEYWKDQRAQARQIESQRVSLSNLSLLLAGAGLGLLAGRELSRAWLPLTLTIIAIGIYGALGSVKLAERYDLHISYANVFSGLLSESLSITAYEDSIHQARLAHHRAHPIVHKIRLRSLWVALHIFVATLGLVFTLLCL